MRKLLSTSAAALVIGFAAIHGVDGSAMADKPDNTFVSSPGQGQGTPKACGDSAGIIQNGQHISGNQPGGGTSTAMADQTSSSRTRSFLIAGQCNAGQAKGLQPPPG